MALAMLFSRATTRSAPPISCTEYPSAFFSFDPQRSDDYFVPRQSARVLDEELLALVFVFLGLVSYITDHKNGFVRGEIQFKPTVKVGGGSVVRSFFQDRCTDDWFLISCVHYRTGHRLRSGKMTCKKSEKQKKEPRSHSGKSGFCPHHLLFLILCYFHRYRCIR